VGGGTSTPAAPGPDIAELERRWAQKANEAYHTGLREGEASGRKRASAEFQTVVERMARSIEETAGLRARLRHEAEADLLGLSLAIARRVLRREISIDPDALRGVAMAALEKMAAGEISRVRVHPSQAPLVANCLRDAGGGSNIEIVPDAAREPGALVFETERGNLDASVESQLGEIERGLADHLKRRA
jgi:flagellar assembly protein FliH